MKQFRTILTGITTVVGSLYGLYGQGQQVTFTHEPALLHPVSGFTIYANCAVDMDGNRLDDIVRVGGKGLYIDFQMPDGSFRQEFFPAVIQAPPVWSVCAGDINHDGLNDLLFADTETFSFVSSSDYGRTYAEEVMPVSLISQRATMADINNDGWLDAFVCNDKRMSVPVRNLGFGQMLVDTTLIPTSPLPGSYGAIWTDYDNDADLDLYISKCLSGALPGDPIRTNLLYQNLGNGLFTEVAAQANLNDNAQSWTTLFEDFDNDGDLDAFVINHDAQNRLYRNNHDGTFTDVIAGSGLLTDGTASVEAIAADFNNDGFIDIFSDLDTELFLGNGDLTFTAQDAPSSPGTIADLNDDGFIDIMKNGQVWLNDGNDSTHWIKILPIGRNSNFNGIGTRVEIYSDWGIQIREVRSGQSYSPMSSLVVHFGLGTSGEIDSLVLRWPSGLRTVVRQPAADTLYAIAESECVFFPEAVLPEEIALCQGDTLELTAPEGYLRYEWLHGDTLRSIPIHTPGHHAVILIDSTACAGVSAVVPVRTTREERPRIYAEPAGTVCHGDTIYLMSTTGPGTLWSTGETGTAIAITQPGMYSVSTEGICSGELLTSEPVQVDFLTASVPSETGVIQGNGDTLILTATCDSCFWFDTRFGSQLLGTGNTLLLVEGTADSVYVENRVILPGELRSGGKPNTTGGGISVQTGFLRFEAWEPFVLSSVKVFLPEGAPLTPRFVQLFSEDTLLAVRQFQVNPGWNELLLDFDVPIGKLSLHCPQGNLFRDTGNTAYPYPLGDVGEIETSSFGDDYYYYFYDWKIQTRETECVSSRIGVSLIISATDAHAAGSEFSLFPNPVSDILTVIPPDPGKKTGLSLYDINGRPVLSKTGFGEAMYLDLSELAKGMYWLQLRQDSVLSYRRIVIQ